MSANLAVALADGLLSVRERELWEPHLAHCGICRQMVAALLDSSAGSRESVPSRRCLIGRVQGQKVGRYTLAEPLGAGGFGVVYRAWDPELGRDVALKLWRFHRPAPAADPRRHLLAEARALAQLSHPNVMAIFEVGRDGDEVFLACELVRGRSCAELLADGIDLRRAVDIALQAAHALRAAHAAGIVHRDVKPDNLLLGEDGRVRVVDFGLASASLGATVGEASSQSRSDRSTMTRSLVGTPAYMAPEQFRGEPATAASDQFSLCVSLFEMLAGKRPFAGASFEVLREAVLADRREPYPAHVPRWLVRVLERGLAPDPRKRHASMQALIDALERAGGSRRRAAVWAACAALPLAPLLWPREAAGVDCTATRDAFVQVWDDARRASLRSHFASVGSGSFGREVAGRVVAALDAYTQSWQAMRTDACEATHVRQEQSSDILDRRVACLDRRRRELAELLDLFETADEALVERAPQAVRQLAPLQQCSDVEALAVLEPLPGEVETRRALDALSDELAAIHALRIAGRYAEGTQRARDAVGQARAIDHLPTVAEAELLLGNLWAKQKNAAEAIAWFESAYFAATAASAWSVATQAATELVYVHGELAHDPAQGERWARHARASLVAMGEDAELEGRLANNVGLAALEAGDVDEAIDHFERALDVYVRAHGPRDISVAGALNSLGLALDERGSYAAAIETLTQAREIFAEALGPHHPMVGQTIQNLGNIHMRIGEPEAAQALFERYREIAFDANGPGSIPELNARFSLATALDEGGRHEEAAVMLEAILEDRRRLYPDDREAIARILNSLAVVAERQGRGGDALGYFEEALTLRREILGADHPRTLFVALNLALIASREGQRARALSLIEEVVKGFETRLGNEHPFTAFAWTARAQEWLHAGNARAALVDAERALAALERPIPLMLRRRPSTEGARFGAWGSVRREGRRFRPHASCSRSSASAEKRSGPRSRRGSSVTASERADIAVAIRPRREARALPAAASAGREATRVPASRRRPNLRRARVRLVPAV